MLDSQAMYRQASRMLLSLGSNQGDREAHLRVALDALSGLEDTDLRAVSHCYETEAWGKPDQPAFVNLAAEIETALGPLELLNAVKDIERALGREPAARWGPRNIDIDIILCEGVVLDTPELSVPHREFRNRAFVLDPLAEIAGETKDPVSGLTISELAKRPEAAGRVRRTHRLDH